MKHQIIFMILIPTFLLFLFNNCGQTFETQSVSLESSRQNSDIEYHDNDLKSPVNVSAFDQMRPSSWDGESMGTESETNASDTTVSNLDNKEGLSSGDQGGEENELSSSKGLGDESFSQESQGENLNTPQNEISLPSSHQWTLLYSHPTLGITNEWLKQNANQAIGGIYTRKRGSITDSAPGGGVAFVHKVKKTDIVEPFQFEGNTIVRNNSLDHAYLLRFKHYVTAHSGAAGKLIELEGGRGYAGRGYRFSNTSVRGTGGWGANIMHPKKNEKNYYRLLASNQQQQSIYGTNFTGETTSWPIKQWITIDLVVQVKDKNNNKQGGSYRLYVDGKLYLSKDNINIFLDDKGPKDAKTINHYVRLMHGGNPEDEMAVRDYTEYFKDLEIYRGQF